MSADKERLQEDNRRLRLQVSDMRLKYDEQIELLAVESARAQADAEDEIAEATEKVDSIRREREALAIVRGCDWEELTDSNSATRRYWLKSYNVKWLLIVPRSTR